MMRHIVLALWFSVLGISFMASVPALAELSSTPVMGGDIRAVQAEITRNQAAVAASQQAWMQAPTPSAREAARIQWEMNKQVLQNNQDRLTRMEAIRAEDLKRLRRKPLP